MAFRAKTSRSLLFTAVALGVGLALLGCASAPEPNVGDGSVGSVKQAVTENGLQIQHLAQPDVSGDVRVTVTNNPPAGTRPPPYLVIGMQDNPIILRDDGIGADLVRGDRVYSTFSFLNGDSLAQRASNESNLINTYKLTSIMEFAGRAVSGQSVPRAFEIAAFNKNAAVSFNASKIFAFGALPSTTKSLLVNDPNVVADGDPTRTWNPCTNTGTQLGAFTFGRLMTEMANQPLTGIDPSDFVLQWLQTWQTTQTINSFNAAARPNITSQVISPWLAASGGVKLNLGIAPFRLLAIVNRLDLRTGSSFYGGTTGNAGELRFVFGVVRPGTTCQLLPFAVILEYGVPINGCTNVRTWAQQWVSLGSLPLGSAAYNTALQALTDQVVLRNAAPAKPNGSALNQLRTNEIALAIPWEVRQFNLLTVPTDTLHETSNAQTPDVSFNASTTLDNFITTNKADIDNGTYVVPQVFSAVPFLGAATPILNTNVFWNVHALDLDPAHVPNYNNTRHIFSLNTCNGCHAGETKTSFTHINPTTPLGSPAALSGFLTGVTVLDPAFGSPSRTFNDLARRQSDLQSAANAACLHFPPLRREFVAAAQRGLPIPPELAVQPVPPPSQQGTFFVEDFFKTPILVH